MTAFIIALKELAAGLHVIVKGAEPWGIMFAVIGLAVSIVQYREEAAARDEERQARKEDRLIRSWSMIQSPNVSSKLRSAAFHSALSATGELTGFAIEDMRVENLEMANIDLRNLRLDNVRFVNGYLENSIIHAIEGSRFSFLHFDLTGSLVVLDPASLIVEEGRPASLKFFSTNLSFADIEIVEQMYDNPFRSNYIVPDMNFTGSWFFEGEQVRILVHDTDFLAFEDILDKEIMVVPKKYKENYYERCRNRDIGTIKCAVGADQRSASDEIFDVRKYGIVQRRLREFRVSSWED